MFFKKATPDSPRIFENDILDMMTRTHWMTVPCLYLPASIGLVWYAMAYGSHGLWMSLALAAGGILAWTLVEYLLHRTLFHWIPNDTWGESLHFWVHGVHHNWPNDRFRLVMPPAVSLTLFLLFLGVWTGLLGSYGWAVHGGFTFGYMCYDVLHYVIHHKRARWGWLKQLKKHHNTHHFNPDYEELRYGVSTRIWDFVFGTDDLPEDEKEYSKRASRRASKNSS